MKRILTSLLLLCFAFYLSNAQIIQTDLVYKVHEPGIKTERAPVLIMLHGYGSNEEDLYDISKSIDQRFIVFSVRAPYKGKDVGYAWYELEFLPNKQFKYNFKQLKESEKKLMSFISNACKAFKADSNKVFVMGFSQGAIMSYDMATSYPKKIAGILALSGRMTDETKTAKIDALAVAKVRIFIAHGLSDNVIDFKEAEKANDYFKTIKSTELTFKTYEMPHAIMGDELNDIKKWLKKQIDPAPKK